jgi:hypothetical protein
MPRGPQGQKRPADAIARAVMIGKIATGEIEEAKTSPAAGRKGLAGGITRSERLLPSRRSEIAKSAAKARWAAKEGV